MVLVAAVAAAAAAAAHIFNPSTGGRDRLIFEASLVYEVNSRIARTIQSCLKIKKKKKKLIKK